jgi:mycothione reductase
MKKYDVIVIGSGAGAFIAENALQHDMSVALIDKGPLGGTCLNLGCIPSKMLVYPADRIIEIREAKRFGIHTEISRIDFGDIMARMRRKVQQDAGHMREGITHTEELDYYETEGRFTGDSIIEAGGTAMYGNKIFIAAGARPHIPEGIGLEKVKYLTNESVLQLTERPESMIIIGGGYIAAEYGHFFSAMGTDVTIVQRNKMLMPDEEPELSERLLRALQKRMSIRTGMEVIQVKSAGNTVSVTGKDAKSGKTEEFNAVTVLVVTGRQSNADLLQVKQTGVKTDDRGYILVDEYLKTNKKNIWAFGDIIGKEMFRHVANREASVAWHNAMEKEKQIMDYHAAPHAIFTYPEVASVGMKEYEALAEYGPEQILIGKASYRDVAMGDAMLDEDGFAKAIVHRGKSTVIGFHIIGAHASILIQETVNAIAVGGDFRLFGQGMHIHPALSEVIIATLNNLAPPL